MYLFDIVFTVHCVVRFRQQTQFGFKVSGTLWFWLHVSNKSSFVIFNIKPKIQPFHNHTTILLLPQSFPDTLRII